jgi:hypothetical protein
MLEERAIPVIRFPSIITVVSGWVLPVTVSMTVTWVMESVCCADAPSVKRDDTRISFLRVRTQ